MPVVHDDSRLGCVEGGVVVVEDDPLEGTEVAAAEVRHSKLLLPEQCPLAVTVASRKSMRFN